MTFKEVLSWDAFVAIVLAIVSAIFLPSCVSNDLVAGYYSIGISVLSIVFSIYFAALAIIIASPPDDFVKFMEEEGDFTSLVGTFKYTLILLFIGLIYSLVSYGITNYLNEANLNGDKQPKWFLVLFVFLFFYSLFATFNSAKDAIYFSAFRAKFIRIKEERDKLKQMTGNNPVQKV